MKKNSFRLPLLITTTVLLFSFCSYPSLHAAKSYEPYRVSSHVSCRVSSDVSCRESDGFAVGSPANENVESHSTFIEDTTIVYTSCDTIKLAATLAIPHDSVSKHPAVILMSGTGQQDRDGTMAGHQMFRDISNYLAERGIAVLRTDDRGTGHSTGDYSLATTADFANDALAAINYLKTRHDIDTHNIGLLGHSEGAATISIAASQCDDVSFIISLCGLMTAGLPSVIQQNIDIVENSPIPEDHKPRYHDTNQQLFRTAYQYALSDSLEQQLYDVYDQWQKDTLNQNIRYSIYMYVMTATSPWYRFFIRYNPADYLEKVNIPVLIINAGKDILVNARQNEESARHCLRNNPDVTFRLFPDLNHLLLPCQYGTQEEYPSLAAVKTSQEVLQLLDSWIHEKLKP